MRYFFLIIALILPVLSEAQLSAPGMSAIRYSSYPSAPTANDPVFIYCNTSGTQQGALTANSPGGTGPFNFTWNKWSDITKSFSEFIKTETGVFTSSLTNLDEGGYRVTVSGGYSGTLTGWIHIDKPFSLAQLQNRTCDYVALKGKAAIDTFYYRDPANGISIKLPNKVKFLWTSDPISSIPFPDFEINPQTFLPPLVDVTYKLHVSDSFGCISESSFFYESIHVKAEFSVDPDKGEAPLEVSFTDKSIRGDIYKWEFGDGKDSISDLKNPDPHIYYKPGEYSVKLTIESPLHCIDSMRFDKIVVDPSDLEVPNVFTPNGDGLNDYFMVKKTSLRRISVEIFSRSGIKVYSFFGEGEALRTWQGWDGNINNSSIKAAPGIYFYLVRGYGWDDIDWNGEEYRGFFYLYR
ncbi:MAG: gliding motility-associated C-terminal domain-containing protein [Bacteroidales bacterium]|nr:gliding motility-associated C-terminal domain-containing protein [Bacteroidales bacterium]MBK7626530.1 gliding motility-associated C-terminal domain-containing protein [Bacteroidales bacterium]